MTRKRAKNTGVDAVLPGAMMGQGGTLQEWIAARFGPAVGASVVRMSYVASEEIDWLWERWIPSRMLTILGGYGGDGKSTLMASLVGAWTTGGALPDGCITQPANVLMLSAEDDVSYAIRPRLDLLGTDSSRVFVLKGTIRGDGRTGKTRIQCRHGRM